MTLQKLKESLSQRSPKFKPVTSWQFFAHLQSSSIPFPLIGNNLYKSCLVQYVLWGHLLFIANTARIVELIGKVKDTLSEDRILIQSSISFALIQIRLALSDEKISDFALSAQIIVQCALCMLGCVLPSRIRISFLQKLCWFAQNLPSLLCKHVLIIASRVNVKTGTSVNFCAHIATLKTFDYTSWLEGFGCLQRSGRHACKLCIETCPDHNLLTFPISGYMG